MGTDSGRSERKVVKEVPARPKGRLTSNWSGMRRINELLTELSCIIRNRHWLWKKLTESGISSWTCSVDFMVSPLHNKSHNWFSSCTHVWRCLPFFLYGLQGGSNCSGGALGPYTNPPPALDIMYSQLVYFPTMSPGLPAMGGFACFINRWWAACRWGEVFYDAL